jgi:hypothetical protein
MKEYRVEVAVYATVRAESEDEARDIAESDLDGVVCGDTIVTGTMAVECAPAKGCKW